MSQRPSRPIKLTRRILFSQMLVLALLGVIAISIGVRLNYVLAEDDNIERLQHLIRIDGNGQITLREQAPSGSISDSLGTEWVTIQVRGGERKSYGPVPAELETVSLGAIETADLTWRNAGRRELAAAKWIWIEGYDVQIIAPRGGLTSLSPLTELLASVFVLVVLLGLLILSIFSLTTTPSAVRRTIDALQGAARQAESIELAGRSAALETSDLPLDVRPLVDTLNETLAKLQRAYKHQGSFLRDAAHELRTPIAILALRIEGLADDPIRLQLQQDVARLSGVADQLLDLQRAKEQSGHFGSIEINDIVKQVLAEIAPLAIDAGYQLSMDTEVHQFVVDGDALAIKRVLRNLLHNSIRYGGNHGTISVWVSSQRYLEVSDQGEGFPPDLAMRMFDPFVRGQQSSGGSGLGLYLVRQIAEMHGAVVSIRPSPDRGACIRVQFP